VSRDQTCLCQPQKGKLTWRDPNVQAIIGWLTADGLIMAWANRYRANIHHATSRRTCIS
jgi:hypothetical protein